MEAPTTLTDMKERHSDLKLASKELWELCQLGKMSDAGHATMHELLFNERQSVYGDACRKVATTAEELAAQFDIFTLEAIEDEDTINMADDYHGQMLRSIRAGISGLSVQSSETNIELFWSDYSILSDEEKKLVSATARALRGAAPALKAAG